MDDDYTYQVQMYCNFDPIPPHTAQEIVDLLEKTEAIIDLQGGQCIYRLKDMEPLAWVVDGQYDLHPQDVRHDARKK